MLQVVQGRLLGPAADGPPSDRPSSSSETNSGLAQIVSGAGLDSFSSQTSEVGLSRAELQDILLDRGDVSGQKETSLQLRLIVLRKKSVF